MKTYKLFFFLLSSIHILTAGACRCAREPPSFTERFYDASYETIFQGLVIGGTPSTHFVSVTEYYKGCAGNFFLVSRYPTGLSCRVPLKVGETYAFSFLQDSRELLPCAVSTRTYTSRYLNVYSHFFVT